MLIFLYEVTGDSSRNLKKRGICALACLSAPFFRLGSRNHSPSSSLASLGSGREGTAGFGPSLPAWITMGSSEVALWPGVYGCVFRHLLTLGQAVTHSVVVSKLYQESGICGEQKFRIKTDGTAIFRAVLWAQQGQDQ